MAEFLSDEWFSKVGEAYQTSGDLQMPDSLTSVTVNLTVKTAMGEVKMAMKKGIIQKGFVDGADVDMSMPADYAYKILVSNDWSVGMRGLIKRHIKLSGKMAKLIPLQAYKPSQATVEFCKRIAEFTDYQGQRAAGPQAQTATVPTPQGQRSAHGERSHASQNVVLPADESPHPGSASEWWYFLGHLNGTDIFGNHHQYGFEVVFTRADLLHTEPVSCIYWGMLAISDITRGTFKHDVNTLNIQPDVLPPGGGFNINIGTMHGDGKNGVCHISAGGFSDLSYTMINLTLSQWTPEALHGDGGIIDWGPFGMSYYYSQTRLNVTGTLIDHGVLVFVTGIGWNDRQWGDFLLEAFNGTGSWDWFPIQLTNNTQYMLYFIKDPSGHIMQKIGTFINADGKATNIDPNSISKTPLGTWTSPHTGVTYEQNWIANVPGGTLKITTQIVDQELCSPLIPQFSYYEGACTVSGTINGQDVTGYAYAEVMHTMTWPVDTINIMKSLLGL